MPNLSIDDIAKLLESMVTLLNSFAKVTSYLVGQIGKITDRILEIRSRFTNLGE
jgi:hypothetical protein